MKSKAARDQMVGRETCHRKTFNEYVQCVRRVIKCRVGEPANIYAFSAVAMSRRALVAKTDAPFQPDRPFTFSVPTEADHRSSLHVRVFATKTAFDVNAIQGAENLAVAGAFLAELKMARPSPDGADLLGVEGWAAEWLWVEVDG